MLPFDATPLDPTSPEARRWLEEELDKGLYNTRPSLWDRFLRWLEGLLGGDGTGGGFSWWAPYAVMALVLLVLAFVLWRVLRPERRGDPTGRAPDLLDATVSAAAYRERATAAEARGEWDTVVLDGYRAIVARAIERTWLDILPGRTAHEAAVALTRVRPDHADGLGRAADAFDAVCYGHRPATAEHARQMLLLDDALAMAAAHR